VIFIPMLAADQMESVDNLADEGIPITLLAEVAVENGWGCGKPDLVLLPLLRFLVLSQAIIDVLIPIHVREDLLCTTTQSREVSPLMNRK
jgi:hypothetical protein